MARTNFGWAKDWRMLLDRAQKALTGAALLLAAVSLGACSTSISEMPLAGTPADAPVHPGDNGVYLPVNDLPPDRDEAAMDPAERAKLKKELLAARERQASVVGNKDAAASKDAANKDQTDK